MEEDENENISGLSSCSMMFDESVYFSPIATLRSEIGVIRHGNSIPIFIWSVELFDLDFIYVIADGS